MIPNANQLPFVPYFSISAFVILARRTFIFCYIVTAFLRPILLVSQYASLNKFWPYKTELTLRHFSFQSVDGGEWASYFNSLRLSLLVAIIGTVVALSGPIW